MNSLIVGQEPARRNGGGTFLRILCCNALAVGVVAIAVSAMTDQPVSLTLERAPDAVPGVLTLTATLTNTSKETLTVGMGGPLTDYELTVTNANGEAVPFSARGKELFSKDHIRSTMYVAVTLPPGESHVDTCPIGDLFEFTRPGNYKVSIKRQISVGKNSWSVASNVLEVTLN